MTSLSPVAERLGVANTVTNVGGELVGDSTDGPGFVDSLADLGWSPEGKRCLVLGPGGRPGPSCWRWPRRGRSASRSSPAGATRLGRRVLAGGAGAVGAGGVADEADLVVNATPVGMAGCRGARAVSSLSVWNRRGSGPGSWSST